MYNCKNFSIHLSFQLIIVFLLTFFINVQSIFAQQYDTICASTDTTSSPTSFPHTGTFKMLIVLCNFSDDTFEQSPDTDLWPAALNSMPSWGPSLLSTTVQTSYQNPSLSGYFKEMSNGSFDVIGDVVYYQPDSAQNYYYLSKGRGIGYLTEEILNGIDPYVNFADYDNNNDGKVDMIQICFRFANTASLDSLGSYQGIAGLAGAQDKFESGYSLTKDGKTISAYRKYGSGTFQSGVISPEGALGVMPHEFGHYLMPYLPHTDGIGYHGLMDGYGSGVMSSYERSQLDWSNTIIVNSNQANVTITDAISTSKVWEIHIPNSSHYFLIDNHQRVSYYENTLKKYNGGPLVSPGTGLLITHIFSNSFIGIESAYGKWDWKKSSALYIYPFEKDIPNKNYGKTKLDLRKVVITTGDTVNHPDYLGSNEDYFNFGYNQLFSPWSNPSTYPDLSNIGVELISKDLSNNIIVNFYVNNPENAQPAKPQNLNLSIVDSHPYLTWDANLESDTSSYKIYKANTSGGEPTSYNYVTTVSSSQTSWTDPVITYGDPSYKIFYKISAVDNTNKESVLSDYVWTNYLSSPNPSQPKNLNLSIINYHPHLTWSPNPEPDIAGYNIYRTENSNPTELI
ncbi:MAG: hypothetical protein COW08_01555, partial [Ignavibacteriales bacterium CG12_big_fil_rev_8_21_14_0_65_30_8]